MSGALVAQAINESVGTPGFQGLDAVLKEYLGLIAEQAGTARVPISRTINGHSLASDVELSNRDVGAAPAGFGLGGDTSEPPTGDLNDLTECGWYAFTTTNQNRPFNYGSLMVSNRYGNQITQVAFNPLMGGNGEMCVRHFYDGTWSEWEYINPPMQVGVEYRTTERWLGSPVYTVLVDCGTAVAGENTISTNFACSYVIGSRGHMGSGAIPQTYDSERNDEYFKACNASVSGGKITIVLELGSQHPSSAPCRIQVWYIKA